MVYLQYQKTEGSRWFDNGFPFESEKKQAVNLHHCLANRNRALSPNLCEYRRQSEKMDGMLQAAILMHANGDNEVLLTTQTRTSA
jgi:hypothetical protein